MAKILFTDNSTGDNITVDDALLLKAYTSNSITNIEYLREEDGYRRTAKVAQTLANVGAMSNLLISLTDRDSAATIWVNKDRILEVSEVSSQASLRFDAGGDSLQTIKLTETAKAVKAAIINKEGDFAYLIDSFTAGPNVVLLDTAEGDVEANFPAGSVFTVFGEDDSNDSIYSVVSATWDGTNTKITVTETPTANASATGYAWVNVADANTTPTSYDPGTAGTGVTAVHTGDGRRFTTVLTVAATDAVTVADFAALSDGHLVYTFPAGNIVIEQAYMSMAVTLAEDTTATPDVGIGTTVGSGANALLSAVGAAAENIITGQTAADCNGTATVATVAGVDLVIATGGDHTVYFNIADTWADTAGVDLTGDIAGTITLVWSKLD